MQRFLLGLTILILAMGCISEGENGNCVGPGPGDPGSGVDLQVVEESLSATTEGTNVVLRVTYYNAGDEPAVLAEGSEGILVALYLDRNECPPSGETSDYMVTLPPQVPPGATAEVGLTVDGTLLASGVHNVYAIVDPTNATWESNEFNNCDGPVAFTL